MEKITINILWENFDFASEILMKHLRKIQPLSKKLENSEITELDFTIEFAKILCFSENINILEEKIDNLNIEWVKKFTEDFKPILENLQEFNETEKEEKKARQYNFWL